MLGIGAEAAIFLYAVLSGMTVLCAYRIMTCVREIIPHNTWAVGAEDFFFWLLISGYLFRQMYVTTYGSIRWFFVLGVVCGIIAAEFVIKLVKKICVNAKKSLEKFRKNR